MDNDNFQKISSFFAAKNLKATYEDSPYPQKTYNEQPPWLRTSFMEAS